MHKQTDVTVRHTRLEDLEQILKLQERVYPGITGWRADQLEQHLAVFPQGQVVATIGARIVGMASSLVVRWDDWGLRHTWREVTGGGTFSTHSLEGRTLYGAEVFTDPGVRRVGVGKKLYQARRTICRTLNLRRIMACGRMPNYHKVVGAMPPEEYAMRVLCGDLADPVLMFQMREGFRYCGVMHGYLPSDAESRGNATVIVWLNPHFNPALPTRIPEGPIL